MTAAAVVTAVVGCETKGTGTVVHNLVVAVSFDFGRRRHLIQIAFGRWWWHVMKDGLWRRYCLRGELFWRRHFLGTKPVKFVGVKGEHS